MKKIFLSVYGALLCAVLSAQTPIASAVYFDTDQHTLTPEALQSLEALSAQLLNFPDYAVDLEAYTDDRGSETYNERLAANRAAAVQAFLLAKGIQPGKTAVKSWGERKQIYDNSNEENRQKNRRVDILVTSWRFDDLKSLQTRLSTRAEQTHIIQATEAQQLTASGGTVVIVPPNSFVFEDGTAPKGPVELTIREALTPADWILNGLTTTSGDQILQSGGMFYVDAKADGKALSLAEGARLTVAMPAPRRVDPEMQLFYGEHNAGGNGIDWQSAQIGFRQTYLNPEINLTLDPALSRRIMALKVPVPAKPQMPTFRSLPPSPVPPPVPTAPHKPTRSTWADAQQFFGIDPEDKKTSSKKVKKAEAWLEKSTSNYLRDSIAYEKAYTNYQQKLEQHALAMKRYEDAKSARRLEMKRRIVTMVEHERKLYFYLYAVAMRGSLKSVGKDLPSNYRNLTGAVRARTGLMTRRYFAGYDLTPEGRLLTSYYYQALGLDFVKSSTFNLLERQALAENLRRDSTSKNIDVLLNKIGLTAISDSLKDEIRQKELEAAKNPAQRQTVVQAYVADIDQLGWVNVDKFTKMEGERGPLAVREAEDASIYVACKDINSILPIYRNAEGLYALNNVLPKGMKVTIVAVKIKEGMPQLAIQDAVVGEKNALELTFKNYTLTGLREEIKKVNG